MIKVILIVISFLSFIFYFVIRGFSNEIAGNSKFNILLISIDTLRADHVSIYNQIDRETTPNIDKIAKVSHVFKRAYSQSSWTLPGHASMLTGLFPSSHQAMRSLKQTITRPIDPLPSSVLTLAEVLKSEGYNTAGIISNPFVSSAFGMDQGFNFFDDQLDLFKNVKYIAIKDFAMLFQIFKIFKLIDGNDYDGERHVFEVNPKALKWLEMNRNEKKPFFLFLHYNEPHYIYEPPYPYNKDDNGKPIEYFMDIDRLSHGQYSLSSRGLKDLLSLYDGEISYLDNQLGELFGKIEQWNLMEKTVIIITSDHGESFNEHEIWQHGNSLYEEQIHVPMIIYCPDLIPKGVIDNKHIVQLVDLMPTILDMLEIPIPTNIQGRSLLPIFKGKPNVQFDLAFAEIRPDVKWKVSNPRYGEGMKAVIKNEWKYILNDNGNEELYNIHIDPSEEKNLIFHQNEKISKMRDIMNVWTSAVNIQQKSKKQEIDRGRLEQLRSLGYVQ